MAILMNGFPPVWLGERKPSQPNAGEVLSVDTCTWSTARAVIASWVKCQLIFYFVLFFCILFYFISCYFMLFYFIFHTHLLSSSWTSRGHRCRPFFPPVLAFNFHRANEGSAIPLLVDFHRVLLTHGLALSASQFVHKKKSPRIYTSMHSGGFELTTLTYTRLEDILICHRGDRRPGEYDFTSRRAQTNPHIL